MGYQSRRESLLLISSYNRASCISACQPIPVAIPAAHEPEPDPDPDLSWPFTKLDRLDKDDIRETAYEVFFTSCRSWPGFGGRHALALHSSYNENNWDGHGSPGSSMRGNGVGMVATSRIKKALGLKPQLRRMPSRRTSFSGASTSPCSIHRSGGGSPGLPFTVPARTMTRRPLTSAEIMRLQMRVTEQSDSRLRKTLMRTFVGQMGRRAETIILPLELLHHLRPSEFNDVREYQSWQRRQLRTLEAGLILHPSIPLDHQSNASAMKLRDIVHSSGSKPIDTGKNSDTMRTLHNCVVSLSWRGANGNPTDVCHWADGHPLNIHLYVALLQSIFDLKEETVVLDEVDELMELVKKTWTMLGINRSMHNILFTWVLFYQYIVTGQTEPDLLCASFAMLTEVAIDANKSDKEPTYVKTLASVLASIIGWGEKSLLDYHEGFSKENTSFIENLLPVVLQGRKILDAVDAAGQPSWTSVDQVDYYIRSSVSGAFAKMMENEKIGPLAVEVGARGSKILMELAQVTEELAAKEKVNFSNTLKRWHPVAAGAAALALHNCYGTVMRQYLSRVSVLTNETIDVLQRARKLEKILVQMVVEDAADCEDGGKSIVREMVPYEIDSIIIGLLRKWVDEKLRKSRDCVQRAIETETWNPKSKTEPFAQSAVDLVELARETVDEFFQLPICTSDDLVQDFADALELVFREYTTFVASCGSKQSYVPSLPPLTRCSRDSRFVELWKRTRCGVSVEELHRNLSMEAEHPRPSSSTSRGTQRLYIRLNTLHYLLSHLNSLDKTLALSPRVVPSNRSYPRSIGSSTSYLELARASMQGAIQHVAEVAAFRLIFLDSNSVFYESLYVFGVTIARIRPAVRILKQNLSLLGEILTDRAQQSAITEIMKASFSVFLMVLLAGGSTRIFTRSDHQLIVEDFDSLKRVFFTSGVRLHAEGDVGKEAEVVEGVIELMGQTTDKLIEDFCTAARERSGIGVSGSGKKLPMPPTTGRWNRFDPNTLLRVLCHRNDHTANLFLKKAFQLPKRR